MVLYLQEQAEAEPQAEAHVFDLEDADSDSSAGIPEGRKRPLDEIIAEATPKRSRT